MKYYFKRHKMITEVIEIEADRDDDAYLVFETSPARGRIVASETTMDPSHASENDVSFWNPKFPDWKVLNS